MRPINRVVILAGALAALSLAKPVRAWDIPAPEKAQHPGVAQAPASDPRTYADKAGFDLRAKVIIDGISTNDLQQWRKGYFTGGDPGKYVQGPSMAKLILDPKAADAIAIMNEDRSVKEQYHFACVNWARFYPLFGSILTDDAQAKLSQAVGKYNYINAPGTENHKVMSFTSGIVLPQYTKDGRAQNQGREQALQVGRDKLRSYVKKLYAAGQGEWDSSTYLMFDLNGMLNVYDFSKDEETRLLAKAALDWYTAAYALKYTDGIYCAPNQRGFAHLYAEKIADNTGWLWWGGSRMLTPEDTKRWLWAMHPVTSSYRPNAVISNIAHRTLPQLPVEQHNSKPDYWSVNGEPKANTWQETVYIARDYTMGSLWKGFGGQCSRFEIVASTPAGGVAFTGGSPIGKNDGDGSTQLAHFGDGNGMFDQSAQVGPAYVCLSNIPDDPKLANDQYAFFAYPKTVKPEAAGDWRIMQAGKVLVAVRPLRGPIETGDTGGKNPEPILKFPGRKSGFVVETSTTDKYPTLDRFAAALNMTKLDASRFDADGSVAYTTLEGKMVKMQYQEGKGRADVSVDGKAMNFENWPVYGGPYVTNKDGILTVNDGKNGFTVDFSKDLPVYGPWQP